MSEALVTREEENGGAPARLVALALEKGADPDTLSKLLDLQQRWEAGEASKKYMAAMTAFKQEAPSVLRKGDRVDFTTAKGRTAYNYANLGSIVQEITAIMGKHDLSTSWSTAQEGRNVTVTCHITHVAGHRESVTLTGPIDESGNKNSIQAVGSTVTYLQRYTLLAALGLATGEDDDGRQGAAPGEPPTGHHEDSRPPAPAQTGHKVSDPQRKRWYAIAKKAGKSDDDMRAYLTSIGFESSKDITTDRYEEACKWAENTGTPDPDGCAQEGPQCASFFTDGTCEHTGNACPHL